MAEDRLEKMKAMAAEARANKEAQGREAADRARLERESADATREEERSQVDAELGQAQVDLGSLETQLGEARQLMEQSVDLPEEIRGTLQGELAQLEADMQAVRTKVAELAQRKAGLDVKPSDVSIAEAPSEATPATETRAEATLTTEAGEVTTQESARDEFLKEIDRATIQANEMIVIPQSEVVAEFKADPGKRADAYAELQKPESKKLSQEFLTAQTEFARKVLDTIDPKRLAEFDRLSKESGQSKDQLDQSLRDLASEFLQAYGYGRGEVYHPRREISEEQRKALVQAALDFGPKAIAEKLRAAKLKRTDEALGFAQLTRTKEGEIVDIAGAKFVERRKDKGEQSPYEQHIKASVAVGEVRYILNTDKELEKPTSA